VAGYLTGAAFKAVLMVADDFILLKLIDFSGTDVEANLGFTFRTFLLVHFNMALTVDFIPV